MKTAVYAHNAAIWLASLAVVEWSNWALVLVAIVTAGVIGWQSWETRKAAEAAKEAADAARENSKALMDSTRAWVTVEPDEWHPSLRIFDGRVSPIRQKHEIRVHIKNRGQTVARLGNAALKYRLLSGSLGELPTNPEYDWMENSVEVILPPENIAPNGFFTQRACLEPSELIQQQDYDHLLAGKAFLFVYGCVLYKNIHERDCETRFAFYADMRNDLLPGERRSDKWVYGGPRAYNRCT
jgi:hypothetical protein